MASKNDKQVKLQCSEIQLSRLLESSDVVLQEYVDGVAVFTHRKFINKHLRYTLTGKRPAKVTETKQPKDTVTKTGLDESLNLLRKESQKRLHSDPDYLPPPQQHDLLYDPYKHQVTGKLRTCKNNKDWKNILERCCNDPTCDNWLVRPEHYHSFPKKAVFQYGIENVNLQTFTPREFRDHDTLSHLSDIWPTEQLEKRVKFCVSNQIPFKAVDEPVFPPAQFKLPAMHNQVPYYSKVCNEEHPIRYLSGCKVNLESLADDLVEQARPDVMTTRRILQHLKSNIACWNNSIRNYPGFISISKHSILPSDYESDWQGLLRITKELQDFWVALQSYDVSDVLKLEGVLPSFSSHNEYVDNSVIAHLKNEKLIR